MRSKGLIERFTPDVWFLDIQNLLDLEGAGDPDFGDIDETPAPYWGVEDVSASYKIIKVLDQLCRSYGAYSAITRLVTINDKTAYQRRLATSCCCLDITGSFLNSSIACSWRQYASYILYFQQAVRDFFGLAGRTSSEGDQGPMSTPLAALSVVRDLKIESALERRNAR